MIGNAHRPIHIAWWLTLAVILTANTISIAQNPSAANTVTDPLEQLRNQAPEATAQDSVEPASASIPAAAQIDPTDYRWWVLAPAMVAIALAIVTRQVIPALVMGIIVGAFMMLRCQAATFSLLSAQTWIQGFRSAVEHYVVQRAILDLDKVLIMVFTLTVGFMVGVIGKSGGTAGMVRLVSGKTDSPKRAGLTAYLSGLVVFFDDYANTMIVGPTMRSVFDKVRLSRAKLAYIVDSTAAPVASVALIGTWVGAELHYIKEGLDALPISSDQNFMFLEGVSAMGAFIGSLPYRFYPIFAIAMVFLVTATGRDFGPMLKAEIRARSKAIDDPGKAEGRVSTTQGSSKWYLGLLPILALVGVTLTILWATGYYNDDTAAEMARKATFTEPAWSELPWYYKASTVISNANSYVSILYGAIAASFVAVVLAVVSRTTSIKTAMDAGLGGMSRMFPAVVILVLAWALSAVSTDLQLGKIVSEELKSWTAPQAVLSGTEVPETFAPPTPLPGAEANPNQLATPAQASSIAHWLPLLVFIAAAGISFATGTSWGTMGILCPVVVQVAANLAAGMPDDVALTLFYASVGSVLAGAIFGDHCSPISDTTVLSSIAAGCPHEEHVWTQIPYALVVALVAMMVGDVLCNVLRQPWYFSMAIGFVILVLIVFVFGRNAKTVRTRRVAPVQPRENAPRG